MIVANNRKYISCPLHKYSHCSLQYLSYYQVINIFFERYYFLIIFIIVRILSTMFILIIFNINYLRKYIGKDNREIVFSILIISNLEYITLYM